jgi:hypothetical protein
MYLNSLQKLIRCVSHARAAQRNRGSVGQCVSSCVHGCRKAFLQQPDADATAKSSADSLTPWPQPCRTSRPAPPWKPTRLRFKRVACVVGLMIHTGERARCQTPACKGPLARAERPTERPTTPASASASPPAPQRKRTGVVAALLDAQVCVVLDELKGRAVLQSPGRVPHAWERHRISITGITRHTTCRASIARRVSACRAHAGGTHSPSHGSTRAPRRLPGRLPHTAAPRAGTSASCGGCGAAGVRGECERGCGGCAAAVMRLWTCEETCQ